MNDFMHEAYVLAQKAAVANEIPVGAVLVENGKIIAAQHNHMHTEKDPTAHAEMLVIKEACHLKGEARLINCDLYVTLEPCAICAAAISFARIRRVYFGAYDPKGGAVDHGPRFFTQPTCHHKPETYGGVMEEPCKKLLQDFLKAKR